MPCSGLKSAARRHLLGCEQQVDGGRAVAGAAGVVGDQPDALAPQRRESIGAKRIESGNDRRRRPGNRQRRAAEIPPGERCRAEIRRHRVDGRSGDRGNPRPERGDVALAIGMDTVGQEHDEHPRHRIDPERRSREAGVPEGTDRQQLAAVARVAGIDVPAERADVAILARHRRRHLRHRQRRQDPLAPVRSVAEQHAAEDGQVGGATEQSGVAGDAAHPPRRRIVNDAAQHLAVRTVTWPAMRRAALGRRDPPDQRSGRPSRSSCCRLSPPGTSPAGTRCAATPLSSPPSTIFRYRFSPT